MCVIRLLLVYYVYYKVFTVCYEGKNSNITSYKMDKATLKKKKDPPKKNPKNKTLASSYKKSISKSGSLLTSVFLSFLDFVFCKVLLSCFQRSKV